MFVKKKGKNDGRIECIMRRDAYEESLAVGLSVCVRFV